MFIYQFILIPRALLALVALIIRQKEGRSSWLSFILSLLVVIAVFIIGIFPDISVTLAGFFGIKRGLDFVFIVGILGSYLLLYKIYNMLDHLENELTELVRNIALKDEYNNQDDN